MTLELDGNIILQQVRLHPRTGSTTIGSRIRVGVTGDLQPGLNSFFMSNSDKLRENLLQNDFDSLFPCSGSSFSLAIDGRCEEIHLSYTTFKHVQIRTVSPHITHDVTRSRVAQAQSCHFHKVVVLSLAQSLLPCMEHAAHLCFFPSSQCSHALLSHSLHCLRPPPGTHSPCRLTVRTSHPISRNFFGSFLQLLGREGVLHQG